MQPQTELLFRLRDWIDEKLPETKAALEELSDDGRIYLEIGPGADERRVLKRNGAKHGPGAFYGEKTGRPGGGVPGAAFGTLRHGAGHGKAS